MNHTNGNKMHLTYQNGNQSVTNFNQSAYFPNYSRGEAFQDRKWYVSPYRVLRGHGIINYYIDNER